MGERVTSGCEVPLWLGRQMLRVAVLDRESFVEAVLGLMSVRHFAAAGGYAPDEWPPGLAVASESPVIAQALLDYESPVAVAGFAVTASSRKPVAALLLSTRGDDWAAWHWWICDDGAVVVYANDWDCGDGYVFVDPSLQTWLETLEANQVVSTPELVGIRDDWTSPAG
jgi:hypothetical protein